MEFCIYQINLDRDTDRVAFEGLENLQRYHGGTIIRSDLYDKIYEGDLGVHSVVPDIKGMRINLEPNLCLEQCRFTAPATQPEQSAKALLKAKIEAEFAEHKTKWLQNEYLPSILCFRD